MRDLDQMVAGDGEGLRDLGDGDKPPGRHGEMHEQAERIVGMEGETHGGNFPKSDEMPHGGGGVPV
jgi:hypothetical protein